MSKATGPSGVFRGRAPDFTRAIQARANVGGLLADGFNKYVEDSSLSNYNDAVSNFRTNNSGASERDILNFMASQQGFTDDSRKAGREAIGGLFEQTGAEQAAAEALVARQKNEFTMAQDLMKQTQMNTRNQATIDAKKALEEYAIKNGKYRDKKKKPDVTAIAKTMVGDMESSGADEVTLNPFTGWTLDKDTQNQSAEYIAPYVANFGEAAVRKAQKASMEGTYFNTETFNKLLKSQQSIQPQY